MSDYISRRAAIEIIQSMYPGMPRVPWIVKNWRKQYEPYIRMEEEIKDLPSAQPEIIRCKDCKHYEIWQLKADYTDDKRYKPSVCVVGRYAVHRSEDWFCADAERRTDED